MTGKRIPIGAKPTVDPAAESWIRRGGEERNAETPRRAQVNTARLTIDVTPGLRARLKVIAFKRGETVADMVRAILEREFPADAS